MTTSSAGQSPTPGHVDTGHHSGHSDDTSPGYDDNSPGYDVMQALTHLDTWDKLVLVAGAVAALVIIIFLLVCCLGDGCLIHDFIKRRRSKKFVKLQELIVKVYNFI